MRVRRRFAALTLTALVSLGGAGTAFADPGPGAEAVGAAVGSPGVGSGNVVQVPLDVPINVCGNTVNIVGLLNPTFGNHCVND
ncbi:chaplin [Streptomyces sp. NPDC053431]|uniref:chaplin n=1 Tax=Streptomyces sp. NPDC053431 TaxID=3365703 RepID=UPI0037D7CB34